LTFSGAMDFETGLKLVQKRGQAMQEAADASSGGMVSVLLLDLPRVEELVRQASSRGMLRLANFLCPGNLVVSGSKEACDELEKLAGEAGARTVRLAVAGAFHTPMMQPAVEKLATALSEVRFAMPRLPVWANVTAKPYHEASEIPLSLARQVVEPVRWEETMRGMMESGLERFVEIGPGRVLAGLLKRINRKADCRNVPA
ncbi:MAG: ACP S-malonyltransferase, partial [Gemmataceae bacterium]